MHLQRHFLEGGSSQGHDLLMAVCTCTALVLPVHELFDFVCKLLDKALQPKIVMHAWLPLQGAHSRRVETVHMQLSMLYNHIVGCLGSYLVINDWSSMQRLVYAKGSLVGHTKYEVRVCPCSEVG